MVFSLNELFKLHPSDLEGKVFQILHSSEFESKGQQDQDINNSDQLREFSKHRYVQIKKY